MLIHGFLNYQNWYLPFPFRFFDALKKFFLQREDFWRGHGVPTRGKGCSYIKHTKQILKFNGSRNEDFYINTCLMFVVHSTNFPVDVWLMCQNGVITPSGVSLIYAYSYFSRLGSQILSLSQFRACGLFTRKYWDGHNLIASLSETWSFSKSLPSLWVYFFRKLPSTFSYGSNLYVREVFPFKGNFAVKNFILYFNGSSRPLATYQALNIYILTNLYYRI